MKTYDYYNNCDKFAQLLTDLIEQHGASEACRALVLAGANAGHRYTGLDGVDFKEPVAQNLFSIAYDATDICKPRDLSNCTELYKKIVGTQNKFTSLGD